MTRTTRLLAVAALASISAFPAMTLPGALRVHAATPVATDLTVHSYPCVQSDSIAVSNDTPDDALPPQWVVDREQATMHTNGATCYTIVGGTQEQRWARGQQLTVGHAALAVITPNDGQSCTNQEYYASAYEPNVSTGINGPSGPNLNVQIHYRVNTDCTHNIYYNNYSVASGNNSGNNEVRIYDAADYSVGGDTSQDYSPSSQGSPLPAGIVFSNHSTGSDSTSWSIYDGFCQAPFDAQGDCNGAGSSNTAISFTTN